MCLNHVIIIIIIIRRRRTGRREGGRWKDRRDGQLREEDRGRKEGAGGDEGWKRGG